MHRRLLGFTIAGLTLALSAGLALASALPEDDAQIVVEEVAPEGPAAFPSAGMAVRSYADESIVQQRTLLARTMKSPRTRNMRGLLPSMYEGEFFEPRLEERRRCIVERESNGHYDAVSPGGGYLGAYQMSPELGVGATWMMLKEHKDLLGEESAKQLLETLRGKPIQTWPRYWQDAAFSTVHNWEEVGSGSAHWAGGRWKC